MEEAAALTLKKKEVLHAIKALHFEEATQIVSARNEERHPNAEEFGVHTVESMKQTLLRCYTCRIKSAV
jgi:hypothetical protein